MRHYYAKQTLTIKADDECVCILCHCRRHLRLVLEAIGALHDNSEMRKSQVSYPRYFS